MIEKIKSICQAYDIRPQRSKGQNFLISQKVLDKIVAVAELKTSDLVLEVGPGLGILTEALVKRVKKVISIELDKKLLAFLKVKFSEVKNLELINQDILKFQVPSFKFQDYKIVANIPYNITSIFLRKFLTTEPKSEMMVLLIQKEVAERICAQSHSAGSGRAGKMSLLSVSVQLYGQPKIIEIVDKQNFWPVPEVDSAILKIEKIKNQVEIQQFLGEITEKRFWQIVRIGFSAKRKKLQNNLSAGLKITSQQAKKALINSKIKPNTRAQELAIQDWLTLARTLKNYSN